MRIDDYPNGLTYDEMLSSNFIVSSGNNTNQCSGEDILKHSKLSLKKRTTGTNLGTVVTDTQREAIKNGTFGGMRLGDYWVDSEGYEWVVIDSDYWNTGDHHLVLMPRVVSEKKQFYITTQRPHEMTQGTSQNGKPLYGGYYYSHIFDETNRRGAAIQDGSSQKPFTGMLMKIPQFIPSTQFLNAAPYNYKYVEEYADIPTESSIFGYFCNSVWKQVDTDEGRFHSLTGGQFAFFRELGVQRACNLMFGEGSPWLKDASSLYNNTCVGVVPMANNSHFANYTPSDDANYTEHQFIYVIALKG